LEKSRPEGDAAEGFSSRARGHSISSSGMRYGDALPAPAAGGCWKKGAALLLPPFCPGCALPQLPCAWHWALLPHRNPSQNVKLAVT